MGVELLEKVSLWLRARQTADAGDDVSAELDIAVRAKSKFAIEW